MTRILTGVVSAMACLRLPSFPEGAESVVGSHMFQRVDCAWMGLSQILFTLIACPQSLHVMDVFSQLCLQHSSRVGGDCRKILFYATRNGGWNALKPVNCTPVVPCPHPPR